MLNSQTLLQRGSCERSSSHTHPLNALEKGNWDTLEWSLGEMASGKCLSVTSLTEKRISKRWPRSLRPNLNPLVAPGCPAGVWS